jgi:hypothetical protein
MDIVKRNNTWTTYQEFAAGLGGHAEVGEDALIEQEEGVEVHLVVIEEIAKVALLRVDCKRTYNNTTFKE